LHPRQITRLLDLPDTAVTIPPDYNSDTDSADHTLKLKQQTHECDAGAPKPPDEPPAGPPPEVSYTDRIRAMCVLMGVGTISRSELPPGAMAAAIASVKDRSAFAGTNYADGIGQYLHG